MTKRNFEYEIVLAAEPELVAYFEYDWPLYNSDNGETDTEDNWHKFLDPYRIKYAGVDMYLVWNYWSNTRKPDNETA